MQIFPRNSNAIARASLVIVAVVVAGLGWGLWELERTPYVTNAGVRRPQPVPFSHQHHVTGLGIDCRYCHTSVEESSFAGIPPTKTCMNCHSVLFNTAPYLEPIRESYRSDKSIQWVKVHRLADFVYFNHSIHVHKGVGCTTCHGQVDRMPLMWQEQSLQMEWCLDCHRNPSPNRRPTSEVTNMKWTPPRDVRVLAATNQDLRKAIAEKRFREDLFYRLNVIQVVLPPLRDRVEDVPLLADHFVARYAAKNAKPVRALTAAALEALEAYLWPGNVRELENAIERAVVLSQGAELDVDALPDAVQNAARAGPRPAVPAALEGRTMTIPLGTPMEEIELRVIRETLRHTKGDKNLAAQLLGIAARTIYRKLPKDS